MNYGGSGVINGITNFTSFNNANVENNTTIINICNKFIIMLINSQDLNDSCQQ